MPDITDHPQYDAVAMMVEERMLQIAEKLGCKAEFVNTRQNSHAAEAVGDMTDALLRAYHRAHSADKAAP